MNSKPILLLLMATLLISCGKDPKTMIPLMNGYWEIDEVTLPNGTVKDYNFNDTIDYIEVTDSLHGFRKKLRPNFKGTYETSESNEHLQIKIENDSLNIYYATPFDHWKETVLKATETQLLIVNDRKVRYLYKRYEPLDLD